MEEKCMNEELFEHLRELEWEVSDAIGLTIQLNTESSLATDWIEDCSNDDSYATYNLIWLLVYHFQEHGIDGLLKDYTASETVGVR